jgi:kynurenine formamidase
VTTQIGGERFTAFRTGRSKSRQAFLSLLRAGHDDYVINDEALRYMRERQLAGSVIETLRTHPARSFPNEAAWRAHLSALGFSVEKRPGPPGGKREMLVSAKEGRRNRVNVQKIG